MVKKIKEELGGAIKDCYDSFAEYSFLTGSRAYEVDSNTDIDFVLVLSDEALTDPHLVDRRKEFNQRYLSIHEQLGFVPDTVFPGEIITRGMLEDVKKGRGFVREEGRISYPEIDGSNDAWLSNPCFEYRCWRSMYLFTQQSALIDGPVNQLENDRAEVISSFLPYLNKHPEEEVNKYIQQVVKRIESSRQEEIGCHASYKQRAVANIRNGSASIPLALNSAHLLQGQKVDVGAHKNLEERLLSFVEGKKFFIDTNPFVIPQWQK